MDVIGWSKEVLEKFGNGFIHCFREHPGALEGWRQKTAPETSTCSYFGSEKLLKEVCRESLTLLYRLLFSLRAKVCGLPVDYKEISSLAYKGPGTLNVSAYNGCIFDPGCHPFLEQFKIGDRFFGSAERLFCARQQKEAFAHLNVRHLGAIYERILEFTPRLSNEGLYYLEFGSQQRKVSGSYYTPDYIVQYLVDETLGPLVRGEHRKSERKFVPLSSDEILKLRVLDPAMGSGHFLIAATEYLARAYGEALVREGKGVDSSAEQEFLSNKRKIAEHCIYGVDVDPMAVELAKLSIWFLTMDKQKPLLFLNHHLKCGNSLVGAWLSNLEELSEPGNNGMPKRSRRKRAVKPCLFTRQLREKAVEMARVALAIMDRETETFADIEEKKRLEGELDLIKQPFKNVADAWMTKLLGDSRQSNSATAERFFHWELEFPEIFFNSKKQGLDFKRGFAAILCNPPYLGQKDHKPLFDSLLRSPIVRQYYEGKMDLWYFFAEVGLDLTARDGLVGILATDYWMSAEGAAILRKALCTRASFKTMVYFNGSVFEEAPGIHSNIIIFSNDPSPESPPADILVLKAEHKPPGCFSGYRYLPLEWFTRHLGTAKAELPEDGSYLNLKIPNFGRGWRSECAQTLGSVCEIFQGIVPGPDSVSMRAWRSLSSTEKMAIRPGEPVFVLPAANIERLCFNLEERRLLRSFFQARELMPVLLCKDARHVIIYLTEETVDSLSSFPNVKNHLERYRPLMEKRRETAKGSKPWYHLHWPRQERLFLGPKIIAVRQTLRPLFTYSEKPAFMDLSVNIIRHHRNDKDFLKALALYLNTERVLKWLQQYGKMKGEIFQVDRGPLEKIPIPLKLLDRGHLYNALLEIFCELEKNRLLPEEAIQRADAVVETKEIKPRSSRRAQKLL